MTHATVSRSGFDDDGRYAMHVSAPAHHGAVIDQAFREARDALFHAGTSMSPGSTPSSKSATAPSTPSTTPRGVTATGSTSTSTPTATAARHTPGSTAAHNCPPVCATCCAATGSSDPLWHTGGVPINVGRARYIVPPHTRRAVSSIATAPAATPAATTPPIWRSTTSSNGSATA